MQDSKTWNSKSIEDLANRNYCKAMIGKAKHPKWFVDRPNATSELFRVPGTEENPMTPNQFYNYVIAYYEASRNSEKHWKGLNDLLGINI